jgi:hypothetical protein
MGGVVARFFRNVDISDISGEGQDWALLVDNYGDHITHSNIQFLGGGTGGCYTAAQTRHVLVQNFLCKSASQFPAFTFEDPNADMIFNNVSIVGGPDEPASATAGISGGAVAALRLEGGGKGYTSAPQVVFVGGGGDGAQATATVAGGVVSELTLVSGGTGYTSAPQLLLSMPIAFIVGGGGGQEGPPVLQATMLSTSAGPLTGTYCVVLTYQFASTGRAPVGETAASGELCETLSGQQLTIASPEAPYGYPPLGWNLYAGPAGAERLQASAIPIGSSYTLSATPKRNTQSYPPTGHPAPPNQVGAGTPVQFYNLSISGTPRSAGVFDDNGFGFQWQVTNLTINTTAPQPVSGRFLQNISGHLLIHNDPNTAGDHYGVLSYTGSCPIGGAGASGSCPLPAGILRRLILYPPAGTQKLASLYVLSGSCPGSGCIGSTNLVDVLTDGVPYEPDRFLSLGTASVNYSFQSPRALGWSNSAQGAAMTLNYYVEYWPRNRGSTVQLRHAEFSEGASVAPRAAQ